ncbi:MAG TPA: hypothetical protein VHF06_26300 [Pseudonocardiaceae bacterium]|nr:hypothetical protein [Pseudonocardiaceae bacterium]
MYRRAAALLSSTFALALLPFLNLPAHGAQPPADAPPPCTVVFFDVNLGQGVEDFCPGEQGTYQVIAQCGDGNDVWTAVGSLAGPGGGPSVATCRGALLFPAHVLSYYLLR